MGTYAHLSNDKVRMCLRVGRVQVEKEVVGTSVPELLTASVPATSALSRPGIGRKMLQRVA